MAGRFADRRAAGRALARALDAYAGREDVVVLALPRGGVPVAFEVAHALRAPLDIFVVRKLGAPGHPELALGAIASGGVRVLNDRVVAWYQPSADQLQQITDVETRELQRRERTYRGGDRRAIPISGQIAILVDDGLATGATMRAAAQAVRRLQPARVVVAVPVGAPDSCRSLGDAADDVICLLQPQSFDAVGLWYDDFTQTTDDEVRTLLAQRLPPPTIHRFATTPAHDAPAPSLVRRRTRLSSWPLVCGRLTIQGPPRASSPSCRPVEGRVTILAQEVHIQDRRETLPGSFS